MTESEREVPRRLLRFAAVPLAAFALVFLGALAYFSTSGRGPDDDAPAAGGTASTAARPTDELPPPSGRGRLLVSVSTASAQEMSLLHLVNLDGSGLRRVTRPRAPGVMTTDWGATWSPDGELIAFMRSERQPNRPGGEPHLYLVRPDGSGLRRLLSGRSVELLPSWSPDGQRIVFAMDTGRRVALFVARPDGRGLRELSRGPGRHADFPAWSPDGMQIAFTSVANENEDLYLMNADGSGKRLLLGGPEQDSAPAWSPGGTRIAFVRDADIYTIRADGSGLRQLTDGPDEDVAPHWSPDGGRIVFTRFPGSILVVNADGSELTRVPLEVSASGAVWEPAP